MSETNSKSLLKLNLSYALERVLTNSIKFLIPLYLYHGLDNVYALSFGYCISFILFTYSGVISSQILNKISNIELMSLAIPIFFIMISGVAIVFFDEFYLSIFIFCIAIISGSMLNPILHSRAKSYNASMRAFSTIDKVSVFTSPLLIGIISIYFNFNSLVYLLLIGWILIGILLLKTARNSNEATGTRKNQASLISYFKLISNSELIKFILIRFLVTSTLTHSIYSILLVELKQKYALTDFDVSIFISFGAVSVLIISFFLKRNSIETSYPWTCILFSGLFSSLMMIIIGLSDGIGFNGNLIVICLCWGLAMSLSLVNSSIFNHEKQKVYSKEEIVIVASYTSAVLGISIVPSLMLTTFINWYGFDNKILLVAAISLCVNIFYITRNFERIKSERIRS